jgi:hypothetical protein
LNCGGQRPAIAPNAKFLAKPLSLKAPVLRYENGPVFSRAVPKNSIYFNN